MLTPASFQVHFSSRFSVHVKGKGTLRASTHRSTHRRLRQSWGWRGAISRPSKTLLSSTCGCPLSISICSRCSLSSRPRQSQVGSHPENPTNLANMPHNFASQTTRLQAIDSVPPKEFWVWVEQGNPAPVSGATNGTGRLSERAPRPEQDQGPRGWLIDVTFLRSIVFMA